MYTSGARASQWLYLPCQGFQVGYVHVLEMKAKYHLLSYRNIFIDLWLWPFVGVLLLKHPTLAESIGLKAAISLFVFFTDA